MSIPHDLYLAGVLVEVYNMFPRKGVRLEYEGVIRQLGDTVIIHSKPKTRGVLRPILKPDKYLTIDKKFYLTRRDSITEMAQAIMEELMRLSPPPWKAIALTCKIDSDMVYCLYGVKYKKKRGYKELKEKLARAERTLIHAGYTDNGGAMWKPPLNTENAKGSCTRMCIY